MCMAAFLWTAERESVIASSEDVAVTYKLDLAQKGINFLPAREDALLFLGEVDRHDDGVIRKGVAG